MEKQVSIDNHSYPLEFPDTCPICHRHGDIAVVTGHALPKKRGVEVIYQCPWQGCKCYFIGYYGPKPEKQLKVLKPQKPSPKEFPEHVHKLSPSFVAIYGEAEEARHLGLNQICGPGYRKAFEFLIKDYAKSKSPEREDEIKQMFSGNVVKDFVTDPRIEAVATRALWLGNDETHYLRKWVGHDVEDLMVLIRLTIDWMEIEQLSAKYVDDMPQKDA